MPSPPHPPVTPSRALFWVLGATLLAWAGGPAGARPEPAPRPRCTADIAHPLEVRVLPLDPPRPGAVLRIRVEVTSRIPFDSSELVVESPASIPVLSGRQAHLGGIGPNRERSHEFTLVLPGDRTRRTVDVTVRASRDGVVLSRGAVLNLNFEEEPSRIVPGPPGTFIREVPARRMH